MTSLAATTHPQDQTPPRRPTVLLADDDASFVASLQDALVSEPYDLLVANDGREAQRLFDAHEVDLVVTDVRMPEVDGITLLNDLSRRRRSVPCIVMTAYGSPPIARQLQQLGTLRVIDKPIDVGQIREWIRQGLEQSAESSVLRGISVASFLQLLGLERKTCTVRLQRDGESGMLFFSDGDILDATLDERSGLDAALELVTWDRAEMTLQNHCPIHEKRIDVGLEKLLLEAMRLEDERHHEAGGTADDPEESPTATERNPIMALDSYLQEFRDIKGYIASGIMDFTGEALVTDSTQTGVDLEATGAVFNDIFRGAHEASIKIGLEACRKMTIATPRGLVVMECSGVDAASHLHFIVVLAEDGNHALARKTMEKIVPKVVAEMS